MRIYLRYILAAKKPKRLGPRRQVLAAKWRNSSRTLSLKRMCYQDGKELVYSQRTCIVWYTNCPMTEFQIPSIFQLLYLLQFKIIPLPSLSSVLHRIRQCYTQKIKHFF